MVHCLGHQGPGAKAHQKLHWLPGVRTVPRCHLGWPLGQIQVPHIAYFTYFCLSRDLYPVFQPLTWPDSGTFLTVWEPTRELQRSGSRAELEAPSKVPQMVWGWVESRLGLSHPFTFTTWSGQHLEPLLRQASS